VFSAGLRFDDFSLVEFRWTRSPSTLRFDAPFAFLGASVGEIALNQFHADFTREFVIGVTHLSAWSNLQSTGSCAARSNSAAVS